MNNKITIAILTAFFMGSGTIIAQQISHTDTLEAAKITDRRMLIDRSLNVLSSDIGVIRGIASPMGEGDAIRWARTFPAELMAQPPSLYAEAIWEIPCFP